MRALVPRYIIILLGLLFVWSAVYKLLYPGHATMALVSLGVPRGFAKSIVATIVGLELYLSMLLLFRIDLKYGLILATGTVFAFTIYLFYLTTLAAPPSCGCLGLTGIFQNSRQEAVGGVARNCAILWVLSWLLVRQFPSQHTSKSDPVDGGNA